MSKKNGLLYYDATPLASPMAWDPHSNEPQSSPFRSTRPGTHIPKGANLFLGLDLSTQALKGSFCDESLKVVMEFHVRFDEDLPQFKTTSGVHLADGGVVFSDVAMWLEALELLFSRISQSPSGLDLLSRVVAISGAAQQHASVYWSDKAESLLASLDPKLGLAQQLQQAFSTPRSPNWQDSSTTRECRDMEAHVGGRDEMALRTGSRAHERFTGPQILKLRRTRPALYEQTSRISLASSFLTTVFCADGEVKPIEESDACGMNLWNIRDGGIWDTDLIAFVSGDAGNGVASTELRRKLGEVESDGSASAGKIGSWWVDRFGLNPDCIISHFTGDNPATLLSFSLLSGDIILSLGTSDTVLLSTTNYAPSPDSHVFAYPANYPNAAGKRSYMAMLCYKNGSLPREKVRDEYAGGSWEEFDRLVREFPAPASAKEASTREIGFWFLKPEIIPHNAFGTHRFDSQGVQVKEFKDPRFNPRAILESQFLSYRLRSAKMLATLPHRIFAVGGASLNPTILSALASVTGAPVYRPSSSSSTSCSIGGCFKAFWSYRRANGLGDVCFEDAIKEAQAGGKAGGSAAVEGEKVCDPRVGDFEAYGGMVERFWRCEEKVCAT